jgi:HAD superfamily hydrolase (TIGR01509 family)
VIGALLWDVDGTLAETERDGHRVAFNQAFEALEVPWRWSESCYGELLTVVGGYERLLWDMGRRAAAPAAAAERTRLARAIHRLKNERYADIVRRGELALRPGVMELLQDCWRSSVATAIVTTTSPGNIEALLGRQLGAGWRQRFALVVSGADVARKKPDPQAYRLALEALELAPAAAVAIEDAPAGIAAARAAAVSVVVTHSHYFPQSEAAGVLAHGPSLAEITAWEPAVRAGATRVDLEQIGRWHAASR